MYFIKQFNSLTKLIAFIALSIVFSCKKNHHNLSPVNYAQFETFVKQTGYKTDAEKYGWSIVQVNVYDFKKVDGANWKKPDGINTINSKDLPVTQVSYNDAIAYCKWSGTRLPNYDEYWELIKTDKRVVVSENELPISPVNEVNILGNVWDITETKRGDLVRLAGGSLFCSKTTCHGTVKQRELFVDKETGNIHIGFSVIK
ncbi:MULTISPECIES: SUMF1/EgtB/PvdO family nonheme iron enzyme [unclassified Tenacibaculum]|uniref:SUMF1/EgtB/PvdO family nonheme iron enzyme n=1 Tax=unclassified Tenacibaculum TaxID=2635139 RepID=UPI001F262757|nr:MULTISPECIES: SUMF1/EgtB/PvdO family nonheme iron enzyme [unclassified Tenacibaculum]MCF2876506.1 formylglycine-generating enzyme family protein [Tenacibaculum sp. Cn5-1]MCF2936587.1 formylglycine-generating enzyme family protein [Tenacibaculum sp. Cn5-34]MCG7511820.1 formylglycine-generating enzyme family protein [Tenacibaculum sp. Cn5-46]